MTKILFSGFANLIFYVFIFTAFYFNDLIASSQNDSSKKAFSIAEYDIFSFEDAKENISEIYKNVLNTKPTGDAENDFALRIIEFHSAVRPMLEFEIKNGKDKRITALARQTLKRHDDITEIMKAYLGKVKRVKNKNMYLEDETGALGQTMLDSVKMTIDKVRALTLQGKIDLDFASLINYHYSGAVSIIDNYLQQGSDDLLMQLAERMKNENAVSIQIIDKWKKQQNKSGK